MDTTKTIQQYLDEITSSAPTPGGGNVSAFCGALASSLGIMVCNLTIGKKKYLAVESEIIELKSILAEIQSNLLIDADLDNAAFDSVMEAFKLPKLTEDEQSARRDAIEDATLNAAKIPAEVIAECLNTLPLISKIAAVGNQNSLSDAAVACSLILAAARGAFMNVLINCASLNNHTDRDSLLAKTEADMRNIESSAKEVLNAIETKLRNMILHHA